MAATDDLLSALRARCGFEAAEVTSGAQLRILARVRNVDNWRIIMQRLKAAELKSSWTLDLSTLYFLKTPNPKAPLVKGWRLILKAPDIQAACASIIPVVHNAPVARVMVDEVELPGGGLHRGYNNTTGKGAQYSGNGGGPSMHLFPRLGGR